MIVQITNFQKIRKHIVQTLIGLLLILMCLIPPFGIRAQESGIIWGEPFNISRTPNATSTDPFLLSDPSGVIHLFWAEKVSDQPSNNPDTLMYTRWDGNNWLEPIDIYFAPVEHGNQIVQYPHATLDEQGNIHLIWLSQPNFPNYALFYSSAPADMANFANAWKPATMLADDLTGTNYGVDIKKDNIQNIHIVYSRVQGGSNTKELRAVTHQKSGDSGETWSDSIDIYTIPDALRGASNNRLITDDQGGLYTSWSEWDQSGNGQAIYFARSLNNGKSWETPIILAERVGNEYERDWNSIALLEPTTIVAFFEGGWRAYRNVMYSHDIGDNWTEDVDAFPGLIGENGFVEFARDSEDTLHIFFANRAREGNTLRTGEGLWHSIWKGDENWSEPILSSPNINMLNPKAVIVGGNRVMTTWYTGDDSEIMVMIGKITNAAETDPIPWPARFFEQTVTQSPTKISNEQFQETHQPTITPTRPVFDKSSTGQEPATPGTGIGYGIIASLLVIVVLIILRKVISK